jgi:subtilisin family serine protease
MKTYSLLFVLSMLLLAAFSPFTYAQSTILSIDPEREIIVMFKPNAVALPNGQNQGSLNDAQISSPTLQQALQNANVEILAKIIPNFHSQDRFIMTHTGEQVELADWSNVYLIRLPQAQARNAVLGILSQISEVVYAEPNGQVKPALIPNDASFSQQWYLKNDGTAQQGNGTSGADIKATQAWDITTGSSAIKIAIVDGGMQTNHPDFTGRVTGDTGDNDGHGTTVTGVAAAQGNNSIGIAGVAWNVGIINEDYGNGSTADVAAAVISAINRGAHVINNSYGTTTYATTMRNAFADAYKANRVAVASMGNDHGQVTNYPAALGQGIIAVGATTNTNTSADYSTTGSWIDVAAPGGGGFGPQNENGDFIFTTIPSSGYSNFLSGLGIEGTSYSAPVVSGIAALLLSYNSGLYNDDLEQIIRFGTVDLGAPGFDNSFGTGRVDARKALDRLRSPYSVNQASASGGTDYSSTALFTMTFYSTPGLVDGYQYRVKRHEVRKSIALPYTYQSAPNTWGRGVATNGYSLANPNFGMGW